MLTEINKRNVADDEEWSKRYHNYGTYDEFVPVGLSEQGFEVLEQLILEALAKANAGSKYSTYYLLNPYEVTSAEYGDFALNEEIKQEMEREAARWSGIRELSGITLKWINVLGSGNCLFNSLVAGGADDKMIQETIPSDINGHKELRGLIVNSLDLVNEDQLIAQMVDMNIPVYKSPDELKALYKQLLVNYKIDIESVKSHMKNLRLLDESMLRNKYKDILDEIDDINTLKEVMKSFELGVTDIDVIRRYYYQLLDNEVPTYDEKKVFQIKEKLDDMGLLNDYYTELTTKYYSLLDEDKILVDDMGAYMYMMYMRGGDYSPYSPYKSVEELRVIYKDIMGKETVWGSELEIKIASKILRKPIIVISDLQGTSPTIYIDGESYTYEGHWKSLGPADIVNKLPIILGHKGGVHYMYATYDPAEWNRVHNITPDTGTEETAAVDVEVESGEVAGATEYSSFDNEEFLAMLEQQDMINATEDETALEEIKSLIDKDLDLIKQNIQNIGIPYIKYVHDYLNKGKGITIKPPDDEKLIDIFEQQFRGVFVRIIRDYLKYIPTHSTSNIYIPSHPKDKILEYVLDGLNSIKSEAEHETAEVDEREASDSAGKITTIEKYLEELYEITDDDDAEFYHKVKDIFIDGFKEYVAKLERDMVTRELAEIFHKLIIFIYEKIKEEIGKNPPLKSEELYYLYNIFKLLDESDIINILTKDDITSMNEVYKAKIMDEFRELSKKIEYKKKSINELLTVFKPIIYNKFKQELKKNCEANHMDFMKINVDLNSYNIDDKQKLFQIYSHNPGSNNDINNILLFVNYLKTSTPVRCDDLKQKLIKNVESNYLDKNYQGLSQLYKELVEDYYLHSYFLMIFNNWYNNSNSNLRLDIIKEMNREDYSADKFYANLHEHLNPTEEYTNEFDEVVFDTEDMDLPTQTSFIMKDGTKVTTLEDFLIGAKLGSYIDSSKTDSNITLAYVKNLGEQNKDSELPVLKQLLSKLPIIQIIKEFHIKRFMREARQLTPVKPGGGKRTTRPKRTKRKTNKRRTKKRRTNKRRTNKRKTQKKKKRSTKRKKR